MSFRVLWGSYNPRFIPYVLWESRGDTSLLAFAAGKMLNYLNLEQ